MAGIFRRLHKKSKDGKWHLIFVITNGKEKRWDISSQVKLSKEFWTPSKRVSSKHADALQLNFSLDQLEIALNNKVMELIRQELEDFQIHLILQHLVMAMKLPDNLVRYEDPRPGFFEFAHEFIRESEATKAKATIRVYKQSVNQLYLFRNSLQFEEINLQFYYAFVNHLSKRGLTNNTIGKHVKVLKTILNEATDRGYDTNLDFRKKRFKVFKEEVDSVYLTIFELEMISQIRHSLTPAKRKICDMFLIGCYTGLRFSDLSGLSSSNIVSDDTGSYIVQRTQKTSQQVVIPLNSKVREILSDYDGKLPGAISNQKTNKALKTICASAGIDMMVEIKSKAGGETIVRKNPKFELVSTHTARRSFATNAFLSGVPVLSIMKITGHKTERAFMDYIKATQFENAMVVAKHPFFR